MNQAAQTSGPRGLVVLEMNQEAADGASSGVSNPVNIKGSVTQDYGGESRKSRFTVKAVPKEESHIQSVPGGGLIVPGTSVAVDTTLSKAQLLSKVEQLFEMNMRMVKLIQDQVKEGDDDHADKNPPERQRSFTANDAGSVSSAAYIPNQSSSTASSSGPASSSSSSSSSSTSSGGGYGKLFHYINEMKKELELSQSKNGESRLEMQRLRERNQQLADQLSLEQNRNATLEERLERARRDEDKLRRRIAKLEAEQQIPRTQEAAAAATATATATAVTATVAGAVTPVGSVGVVSPTMATGSDPDSKSREAPPSLSVLATSAAALEGIEKGSRDESESRGADSGHSFLDVSVALSLSNLTVSASAIPVPVPALAPAAAPASMLPPSPWAVAGGRALPSALSMSAPLKPRSRSGSCSEERKDGPASAPQPIPLPVPQAHPSAPVERDPLGEIASRFF